MESKPKILLVRRRNIRVHDDLSFNCSASELDKQLIQLESNFVETQVDQVVETQKDHLRSLK